MVFVAATVVADHVNASPTTRADLAPWYIAVERSFQNATPSESKRRWCHVRFDRAAAQFFRNDFAEAARHMATLQWYIEHDAEPTTEQLALLAIQFDAQPRIWVQDKLDQESHHLRLRPLFNIPKDEPIELSLQLNVVDADEHTVLGQSAVVTLHPNGQFEPPIVALNDRSTLDVGTYRLRIEHTSGVERDVGRLIVSDETLSVIRDQFAARLDAINPKHDHLESARITCIGRINLLQDGRSATESAQFMLDPIAHIASIEREIELLEDGVDPYRRWTGELWRTIHSHGQTIPIRTFAPPTDDPDRPRPLVIALHGAGGDERMFLDAYGGGLLRSLARKHDFIIASPLTYPLSGNPSHFDQVLNTLTEQYAIDESRVYLIGHSFGGATATMLANERPQRIAAIACIAGAGRFTPHETTPYPPALVLAPELDSIVPPARLERLSVDGRNAGASIDYRVVANNAHLLVVGEVLPEAIEWLLDLRNDSR